MMMWMQAAEIEGVNMCSLYMQEMFFHRHFGTIGICCRIMPNKEDGGNHVIHVSNKARHK
jgi:hypothetical protein